MLPTSDWHGDVVGCHGDIVDCHVDIVDRHGEVNCYGDVFVILDTSLCCK